MGDYFSTPLAEFQTQCLTMVSALVKSQGSLFCLFNRSGKPEQLTRHLLGPKLECQFLHYSEDLHTRYAGSSCPVIVDAMMRDSASISPDQPCFASLVFRRQKRVEGLLGLVRTEGKPFDADDVKRLEVVHPVIDHVLHEVYLGASQPRIH